MTIFHAALAADWDPDAATYEWSTRGRRISDVGFLHASEDEHQLANVIGAVYADVSDELVVLEIDDAELPSHGLRVVIEPGDPSDPESERFPHVYGGALPTAVVSGVRRWPGRVD